VVDPGQLQQIILNLAINSRDAMPRGGKVTLSTENVSLDAALAQREGLSPGDYVCLAVSDTGMGIGTEVRDRLFEPFFTTKPPGEGTGLGLSMVYGIVQQSGGSIQVESERGRGTTFRIYLPRVASVEESGAPSSPGADARGSETILLVEDSPVVRSLVRELLEHRGYRVLEARDAQEAILISDRHQARIDLLLTDLMMPRMGGHDLAARLRRRRKGLKVLYMSGYSGEGLQAVEKGSHFLEKPFKPEALAAYVRKVLDEGKASGRKKAPTSSRK
jgi:two-component system, cell cycle sensor histidine kinase and response regulator CckA